MKRVLIVDDAIELGRLFQEALKSVYPGLPVTVVPSAEEALLESTRFSFDLLVTDLRLPGMSGLELIRKIRARQPQIKVMLITALSPEDRLMRHKDEVNPDAFLRKPISMTVFLDEVNRLAGESEPVEPAAGDMHQPAPVREDPAFSQEPPKPAPEIPPEPGLSAILSRLRGSLGAYCAMLLDESGHQVAKAGDLPGPGLEEQLIAPMLAALSAGARVSYLLGQLSTRTVQAYRGDAFDIVLAPVGQYTLLLALRPGRTALRLALAVEEAFNAQDELQAALEAMGLHVQSAAEAGAPETILAEISGDDRAEELVPPEILETPLGQDPGLDKFEELFIRKKTGQLKVDDPDAFWDAVSSVGSQEISSPGVLSFDQAQKLGLVPPDPEQ